MPKKKNKFTNEEVEEEKIKKLADRKFTKHELISMKPKNNRQKQFVESFFTNIPIIVQDGPAGTGKSFLALYCALSEVFESPVYRKVILIRSPVEGRSQGFLPGDEEEKNEPFERPYMQIIDHIITEYNNPYMNLKATGLLEFYTTANLRGFTFDNSVIILDEAQNADYDEIKTVVTRIGNNTKIIICGDTKQNDLDRQREVSGFEKLKNVLTLMPMEMHATIRYGLQDIVRSGVVREFLIADHEYEE